MRVNRSSLFRFSALSLAAAVTLAGCGGGDKGAQGPGGPGGGMPPAEVGVITVSKGKLPLTSELPGRIEAVRTSEVRARVAGIVLKREFREGSEVKAGEVLYRIDPAPYVAALDSAKAQLARAEATATNAKLAADRANRLIDSKMISQQDYDTAMANAKAAQADVAAAKAAIETARLNVGYATVTAPISGRIGKALVTEGALVGQGEATQLALIQQVDPVYVNFSQSSTDILKLKKALESGQIKSVAPGQAQVTLLLEDGTEYAQKGKLLFSDLAVDPSTGNITLRGEFANPDRLLLPGMYVRIRLEQGVAEDVITVPQRAVMRNPQGAAVLVVAADGKVEAQPIKTDTAQGDLWVVSDGLKGGEQVIVEGLQKAKPGATVKAVPAGQPAPGAAPAAAQAGK